MIGNHNNQRQLVSMQRKWQMHAFSVCVSSLSMCYDGKCVRTLCAIDMK